MARPVLCRWSLSVVVVAMVAAGCAAGDEGVPRTDGGPGDGAVADGGPRDSGPPPGDAGVDAGPDSGPIEIVGTCEACVVHEQCGALARCVPLTDGSLACLPICELDLPSCARGFTCVVRAEVVDFPVCVPLGERCCVDEDADAYGVGVGCMGPDCDDANIARNPGVPEMCNAVDDDCDTEVDDMPEDCGFPDCRASGMGYEQLAPSTCTSGTCMEGAAAACGLYTCDLGAEEGDHCATTCTRASVDDDGMCIPTAHCDLGSCATDEPDGGTCDEDSDCASGHCDNGFCCTGGTCCNVASDCPSIGGIGATCDDTATCQGSRGEITCEMNRCGTRSGVADDTACGTSVEANTCGYFRSVYCTGAVNQPPPACPSNCSRDDQCDDDAHCDFTVCVPDQPDGERCDEASDCVSGHCQNGFCCAGGDCCGEARDCPASYSTSPVCGSPSTCQGTRNAATCVAFSCGTATGVGDDSACTTSTLASSCGLYPSRYCTGALDQPPPMCAMSCTADSECDENAHCDLGSCVPDLPSGSACDEASDCASGHCQNGYCCATGDCCATASDCSRATYGEPSTCLNAATCQGQRRDPVCNSSNQCQLGGLVDDDSGCAGLVSNLCGLYPSVSCTSMTSQPPDQMARCASSCTADMDCDFGAYCGGGTCMPRGMTGDACVTTSQCGSGLSCVDGVCCTSACTGGCMACNVPGFLGTCSPVPNGQDPSGECGAVSCSSYYWGWSGALNDQCYRRADAPASAVACNGSGACQGAADVCPSQGQGSLHVDCDDVCQSETAGTCTGTTAGTCTNAPAGSQSCGTGACARTTALCNSGTQVTCMPGAPTGETCNAVDDDCDMSTDEGLAGDGYETNNSCGTETSLETVYTAPSSGRPSTRTFTPTLYPSGDVDIYTVLSDENDSTCHCCDFFCTDEDIAIQVRIDVPAGAGSYELCVQGADSCPGFTNCVTVSAGGSGTRTAWRDGACGSDDVRRFYFRVRGIGAPGFICNPYTLTVTSMGGCG